MKLPDCIHRIEFVDSQNIRCASNRLIHPVSDVTDAKTCLICPFAGMENITEEELKTLNTSVSPPSPERLECVHRGPFIGTGECTECGHAKGQTFQKFACVLHAQCSFHKMHSKVHACAGCLDRDDGSGRIGDQPFMTDVVPKPAKATKTAPDCDFLFTGSGVSAKCFQNAFFNQSIILVGGGPSLKKLDLSKLNQPGVMLAAMNNVAAMIRPHLWFIVDVPHNFSPKVWNDPAIIKIVKDEHDGRIIRKLDNKTGKWVDSHNKARDLPNTYFFKRDKVFTPSTFLTQPLVAWRNQRWEKHEECPECDEWKDVPGDEPWKNSETTSRSVMFPAIRVLFWMGFRRIFLLGCDFKMDQSEPYSFDETVSKDYAHRNNHKFKWLNKFFKVLRPHFEEYGLKIYNATDGSHLNAFERVTYEQAISCCTDRIPKGQATAGLYKG